MKIVKKMVPVLLLVVGLGILAYPGVSDYVNRRNSSYALQELSVLLEDTDSQELDAQLAAAKRYNESVSRGEEGEGYDTILDFGNGIMGAVEIPGIQVNLPIYHGITEEVLSKGVGHMPTSALPIGGEGNHTVLTGHTGLPSAKLFTDLTKLQEGDLFYLRVLGEKLCYQVDQVKVVEPTDGTDLEPVAGKDHCTLLTCTPYGVNSHRLLVRGIRTEPPAVQVMAQEEPVNEPVNWDLIAIVSGVVFLVCLGVVVFLLRKGRRH